MSTSAEATKFLFGHSRHLTGDAAWEAFVALGGDGLAANHGGWHRRDCPAHVSRSENSLVYKLDEGTGVAMLIVHDHAGCTEREILEAIGVDTTGIDLTAPTTGEWLARGARRPATFPTLVDAAERIDGKLAFKALTYFAGKRQFDLGVLMAAGVTVVRHWERDQPLRARFPFTLDGQVVGAWDRMIADGDPRWIMTGANTVPFGWDRALAIAERTGHVYIVEGPTDAVALAHAFPDAAILGCGVGRAMWHPWWGPELQYLTVWVIADNDTGGAMTRRVAHEVLDPHAWEVIDVRIPEPHNDVDDWRRATGPTFTTRVVEAIQGAALRTRRTV